MTYTVKKGDTLSKIAREHNTTVLAIQKANPDLIKNINVIQIGWVLKIPTVEPSQDLKQLVKECVLDIERLSSFQKLVKELWQTT